MIGGMEKREMGFVPNNARWYLAGLVSDESS
jgi:hypothetical protein